LFFENNKKDKEAAEEVSPLIGAASLPKKVLEGKPLKKMAAPRRST
jgi:hypothetical protein